VIDLNINKTIATIPVGTDPQGIAIHPDGSRLYVANKKANTISVIDAFTHHIISNITVGISPQGVAVHPDGSRLYVTNNGDNVPNQDDTMSVVDTNTNQVISTVNVGNRPFSISVNPTGTRIYVSNHVSSTISVIDANTNQVVSTIGVGTYPWGVMPVSNSQCGVFTSPNMKLRCVKVGGETYQANLKVISNNPTRLEVDVNTLLKQPLTVNNDCAVYSPASSTDSLNKLRMNCLEIGSDKYWMDLNLINSNPIQFEMLNSAKN